MERGAWTQHAQPASSTSGTRYGVPENSRGCIKHTTVFSAPVWLYRKPSVRWLSAVRRLCGLTVYGRSMRAGFQPAPRRPAVTGGLLIDSLMRVSSPFN
ncbi:hypothetical protein D9M69_625930 [compost metagenome]